VRQFDAIAADSGSLLNIPSSKILFLSLNRFDPSKQVEIALNAFSRFLSQLKSERKADFQLVIAGISPMIPLIVYCFLLNLSQTILFSC